MKSLQILVLLVILGFSSTVFAQEKESEKQKETEKAVEKPKEEEKPKTIDPHGFIVQFWCCSRNQPKINPEDIADVIYVELSKTEIIMSSKDCEKNKIEVLTKIKKGKVEIIGYAYTSSAGKIVGKGEKVIWDLSGVKPGTYLITAAVDDGCGFCGKTQTKTVTVKE